jgi:hypothetical protein
MAILEKATNNYYKILFDECRIDGTSVTVAFEAYKSAAERVKEKNREALGALFFSKAEEKIGKLYDDLIGSVQARGLEPLEILSTTEENKIDGMLFLELRQKQDKLHELEQAVDAVRRGFYIYSYQTPYAIAESTAQTLSPYGFNKTWMTDPIVLTSKAEIYCGEYAGEPLTNEFYYNKLKLKMSKNIADD